MDLAGAVALVTGAGSGIGRATALQLACGGAAVTVNDIDEPSARETVGLIEHHGGRATSICADVADDTEVRRMIATTRERFGRLDILVNNAGIVEAGAAGRVAFPEIESERWMRMLDVNVRAGCCSGRSTPSTPCASPGVV
jgi:NAD(P)-dependent dehydrogenase (short-subunit alcohol dehydrogenase family)